MAKCEPICEVSYASFDPTEGDGEQIKQAVKGEWDEEARRASLRL